MESQICVTGIGVCSAIGNHTETFARHLQDGISGVREHVGIFHHNIWAGMAELDEDGGQLPGTDRAALLALQAARAAWEDAFGCAFDKVPPHRVALVLGTSHGGRSQIDHCLENPNTFESGEASVRILEVSPHYRQTEFVARALRINGPVITVSTACSSSNAAILHGIDLLNAGKVDYVLAGGVDGFSKLTHAGFRALGAVADGACGPFSNRIGISLGEGAAIVVLERLDSAMHRNAAIWAELYGGGSSWDCYHATEPEPSGEGLLRALEMAVSCAGMHTERAFCYANLHGTGTRANDAAETLALKRFFGDAAVPPASSVKSFTGHTLGASGAMGLIASVLGMHHNFLPPTVNYSGTRPGCDLDYVPNQSRPAEIRQFSAQSAGFGGVNVVVMGGRTKALRAHAAAPSNPIVICGMGVVSAAGIGVSAFRDSLITGRTGIGPIDRFDVSGRQSRLAGLVRDFNPRKIAPTLNLRRVDLCFQYAAVAVAEALASANLAERGIDTSRVGLVVGTTRGAVNSFEHSMHNAMGGAWDKSSAMHFPNLVMSALGGYVSKMFSLRGAASTLVCPGAGGLQAIINAFELLRCNPTQDAVVVVLADEISPLFFQMFDQSGRLAPGTDGVDGLVYHPASRGAVLGEGAAAFVLEKSSPCRPTSGITISGYGITSDSEAGGALQLTGEWFSESIRQALSEADVVASSVDIIYGHGTGTPCQDTRELRALSQVCHPSVPMGCVLPNTGLSESASSGFSLLAASLSLLHGEAYPVAQVDLSSARWNFIGPQPLHADFRNALLTSSSDAGNNTSIVLRKVAPSALN